MIDTAKLRAGAKLTFDVLSEAADEIDRIRDAYDKHVKMVAKVLKENDRLRAENEKYKEKQNSLAGGRS